MAYDIGAPVAPGRGYELGAPVPSTTDPYKLVIQAKNLSAANRNSQANKELILRTFKEAQANALAKLTKDLGL